MIEISEATTFEQLEQVRSLMRAFVSWHRQTHVQDLELIDEYFDSRAFEHELASLPGKYSPPEGRLLLASHDGRAAGCVALHDIGGKICEMKRMFVSPQLHGKGIGRALAEAIVQEARSIGYESMRLDTGIRQAASQGLYESLGFRRIKAYYELPKKLEDYLVFMELKLQT